MITLLDLINVCISLPYVYNILSFQTLVNLVIRKAKPNKNNRILSCNMILQMSFMAMTATIENKTQFPTILTVNQATDALNPLRIQIMKEFKWTRVGAIVYKSDLYMSVRSVPIQSLLHNKPTDDPDTIVQCKHTKHY